MLTPVNDSTVKRFQKPLKLKSRPTPFPSSIAGRGIEAIQNADVTVPRGTFSLTVSALRDLKGRKLTQIKRDFATLCGPVIHPQYRNYILTYSSATQPKYVVEMAQDGVNKSVALITHSTEFPKTLFVILVCATPGFGTATMDTLKMLAQACSTIDFIHLHAVPKSIGFYRHCGYKAGRPDRNCKEPRDVQQSWETALNLRNSPNSEHALRKHRLTLRGHDLLAVSGCFERKPCGEEQGYPMTLCLGKTRAVRANYTWQTCTDCPKYPTQVLGHRGGECGTTECKRRSKMPYDLMY